MTSSFLCWYFFSPENTVTSGSGMLFLCRFSAQNKRVGLKKLKKKPRKKGQKKRKIPTQNKVTPRSWLESLISLDSTGKLVQTFTVNDSGWYLNLFEKKST